MAADVFFLETTHMRRPSGLILPGRGKIVAVVGAEATEYIRQSVRDIPDAELASNEAGVLLQPDVFVAAALDAVVSLGYARLTPTGERLMSRGDPA